MAFFKKRECLAMENIFAWILSGTSEPLIHFFLQCHSVSPGWNGLSEARSLKNSWRPTLIYTSTLNRIKPSVSFSSLQERKIHGLEVGEGSGICEERSDKGNMKEHCRMLRNTVCKKINPVQTVQSLTWSLSSPNDKTQHVRENKK